MRVKETDMYGLLVHTERAPSALLPLNPKIESGLSISLW